MADGWPVQLVVDAHGHEETHVRARRVGNEGPAHLAIRIGSLQMYCLDAGSVTAMAQAWARAYACGADTLPLTGEAPRPLANRAGYAATCGSVVCEGQLRWDVTPPRDGQPYVQVASSWLTVRVHDAVALRTYTRAWAQASDLGQTVLRRPPEPFSRLLMTASAVELGNRYRRDHPNLRR